MKLKTKLYLLQPRNPDAGPWDGYDVAVGMIVRAFTKKQARHLAAARAGAETFNAGGSNPWLSPKLVSCERLWSSRGDEQVVLRDFRNG